MCFCAPAYFLALGFVFCPSAQPLIFLLAVSLGGFLEGGELETCVSGLQARTKKA